MPMIDAFIPEGALSPDAEAQLFRELTDLLIRLEGFDPTNDRARSVTVLYLHRPVVFVAGTPATRPRYRFILSVPEGQYTDEICEAIVKEVTEAVVRAEQGTFDDVSPRVWVFPNEVPDGRWGGSGGVRRLPDILGFILGKQGRQIGREKLADRRRRQAAAIVESSVTQNGDGR
jgi:phenylpyruvate tautomerase PptA (4-oxalocrotonate tautomerase family)